MTTNDLEKSESLNIIIPKDLFDKINTISKDKLIDKNQIIIQSIKEYIDNEIKKDYKGCSTSLRERFQ